MLRYVVFMWNEAVAEQVETANRLVAKLLAASSEWVGVLAVGGCRVYYATEQGHQAQECVLHGDSGVVLGTLFKRTPSGEAGSCAVSGRPFDASTTAKIIASGGRHLIEEYWGNYVAVIHDAAGGRTLLLRGPASSLPALRTSRRGVEICFSSMEDCRWLDIGPYSIDWDYVAVHMLDIVATRRTGLQEVGQVQPGECLEVSRVGAQCRTYWDPTKVANTDVIESPDRAAAALYEATTLCVHAWASRHQGILHNLSGGLDSSIVLAFLMDAPTRPRVTCITDYSPGSNSDEREYARLAARFSGDCVHVEQRRNSAIRLEMMLDAARSAIPQGYIRGVETSRTRAMLARECAATAIFSGSGGDQLFFQNAELSTADFVHRHGIRPRLGAVAYDSAQLAGQTVWSVVLKAIHDGILTRDFNPLARKLKSGGLVTGTLLQRLATQGGLDIPWRRDTRQAPPGKLWHIHALLHLNDYYDPMRQPGDPQRIAPLLSQPLIETVLRIPTYVLVANGWDRGLARQAFARKLPPQIAQRRNKGGMEEHTMEILRGNLPFIRRLLLDGLLVQQGLLDRAKVAEALADRPSGILKGMAEISRHISMEAWLRQWVELPLRAAA